MTCLQQQKDFATVRAHPPRSATQSGVITAALLPSVQSADDVQKLADAVFLYCREYPAVQLPPDVVPRFFLLLARHEKNSELLFDVIYYALREDPAVLGNGALECLRPALSVLFRLVTSEATSDADVLASCIGITKMIITRASDEDRDSLSDTLFEDAVTLLSDLLAVIDLPPVHDVLSSVSPEEDALNTPLHTTTVRFETFVKLASFRPRHAPLVTQQPNVWESILGPRSRHLSLSLDTVRDIICAHRFGSRLLAAISRLILTQPSASGEARSMREWEIPWNFIYLRRWEMLWGLLKRQMLRSEAPTVIEVCLNADDSMFLFLCAGCS